VDAKGEARAEADGNRHAEEFRIAKGITIEEWKLAEEYAETLCKKLLEDFWNIWEEERSAAKVLVHV
jgi:hypothetical protein